MTCKDLIGYQLVSIDNTEIVVQKGDEIHTLHIVENYGDCCGFNEVSTELFIDDTDTKRNPVITNVEIDSGEHPYASCDSVKITFFGEYKPIARLNSLSSSGSGWCYGACVTIVCDSLDIDEQISRW